MIVPRIKRAFVVLFASAILLPLLPVGCGDDRTKTGTQLNMSDEAKAQIKDMREMYKENMGMRKPKAQ